jgi:hypothetical protein
MELSRETVKNLVDVLRTLNLTITAVPLGLLSNFLFAWTNVPAHQRTELRELSHIVDQIGSYSATRLFNEMAKQAGISTGSYELTVSIDRATRVLPQPVNFQVVIPSVLHPAFLSSAEVSKDNIFYLWRNEPIGLMDTLDQLSQLWNALGKARYLLIVRPPPKLLKVGEHALDGISQKEQLTLDAEAVEAKQDPEKQGPEEERGLSC